MARMKLLTKEILKKLPKLYETEEEKDPMVIVKFFNPCGRGTWYAIEYDPEKRLFYGVIELFEKELGYFSLDELENIKLPFGLKIERDKYFTLCKLSEILNN